MQATEAVGTAFSTGSATLMARIVNDEDAMIVQADIASGDYTVYRLDPTGLAADTPIAWHSARALVIADCIFDTLRNDAIWTIDTIGFNFRHVLDVRTSEAFATPGTYRVVVRLRPLVGQVIIVRYRITVI